jgi:hypothetical protein
MELIRYVLLEPTNDESLPTSQIFEWTPCAVAIVVTLGRFFIRWHYVKGARLDDLFCGLACASLIGFIAMNHIGAYTDDDDLAISTYLSSDFLLWSTLYFVKASFLALMWMVFNIESRFRKMWFFVSAYTLIAYIGTLISELWTCGSPSDFGNTDICSAVITSDTGLSSATPDIIKIVLHLSSDFMILALPLFEVHKLQMTRTKKFSVIAVFALTIIDIISGIIRNSSSICEFDPSTFNSPTCVDLNIITAILEPSSKSTKSDRKQTNYL